MSARVFLAVPLILVNAAAIWGQAGWYGPRPVEVLVPVR